MALHHNPRIVTEGLIFLVDPADPSSYNPNSNELIDVVGGKTMTLGSNTIPSTEFGILHFSSDAGEEGAGTLDTGYRYGSITNNDKIVGGDTSFTVMLWLYKGGSNPNNWWHVITDGHSGDIFTINQSNNFVISMNNASGGATGAAGTYSGVSWNDAQEGRWNMVGVRYNINTQEVSAFVANLDEPVKFSAPIATDPINPEYKIRNFVGWGSPQSSYHADPSHSHCIVYNRDLSDSEITENFEALKPRFT